jgi:hypothetical protein
LNERLSATVTIHEASSTVRGILRLSVGDLALRIANAFISILAADYTCETPIDHANIG